MRLLQKSAKNQIIHYKYNSDLTSPHSLPTESQQWIQIKTCGNFSFRHRYHVIIKTLARDCNLPITLIVWTKSIILTANETIFTRKPIKPYLSGHSLILRPKYYSVFLMNLPVSFAVKCRRQENNSALNWHNTNKTGVVIKLAAWFLLLKTKQMVNCKVYQTKFHNVKKRVSCLEYVEWLVCEHK